MMNCSECGQAGMVEKIIKRYHYTECGLPNIYLRNIQAYACVSCGSEDIVIPNILGLHQAIATDLAHKTERLRGVEIRFMRKYLGYSGKDFADVISVTPETVSRWENQSRMMDPTNEKLLRVMVLGKIGPVSSYEYLKEIEEKLKKRSRTVTLDFGKKKAWHVKAA